MSKLLVVAEKIKNRLKSYPRFTSQLNIDYSGMTRDSLNAVRKQRAANIPMRPIEVSIYPDTGPVVIDGRHRLSVAQELRDPKIEALVRVYDADGNIVSKYLTELFVDT